MFIDDSNQSINYNIKMKAAEKRVPIDGTFELTPRCSMSCKMCYIVMNDEQIRQSGKREKTAKEWLDLAEDCCKEGLLYLLLTGGEAMYRKDFREIYEGLASMGLNIRLNSNGTLFTPDNLDWLVKHPPNKVNITLYGSSNETYERLCGVKNGYDRVKKAILDLLSANIDVKVNATMSQYNSGDLEKILDFIKEYNLNAQVANYSFPTRRRDGENAFTERIDCKSAAAAEVYSREKLYGDKVLKKTDLQIKRGSVNDYKPMKLSCLAGQAQFWITWDGRMLPCCLMDNIVTHPFEDGFANAWKELTAKSENIFYPKECWNCDYRYACMACPGIHYCETGNMNELSSYVCGFSKHYVNLIKERAIADEK